MPKSGLANLGPPWITAIAALITAAIGALAIWGIGANRAPAPRVEIRDHQFASTTLAVNGSYAGLDADTETVVVLLRPATPDSSWAIQQAELLPRAGTRGDESGEWIARLPVRESGVFEISAAVVPARRAGGFESSVLDELRQTGREADVVIASADVRTVQK
jgi:hypothetical protein